MKKVYTSDTHLFHDSDFIVKRRGYTSIEDMHIGMIDIWNKNVDPEDEVYIIGDVALPKAAQIDECNRILKNLNGFKFLIKANHDNEKLLKKIGHNFIWVKDRHIVKEQDGDKKQSIFLDHYPILTWERAHHGIWQLHGHCHGSLHKEYESTRLDVGWDVWGRPITFQDIKEAMKDKKYVVVDHHGE